MTTDEAVRFLEERNASPDHVELVAKVEFLDEQGLMGQRLYGRVRAVSDRHKDCLGALADGAGPMGKLARRSTTKALVKAENMLRREADKVIDKHQLERQWERRREALVSGVEMKQKDAFGQLSGNADS